MIDEQVNYQSVGELSPELASAILSWVLAVSDSKHRIGMQFSHWVTGTPALEAAVGSAAMTQDELGHARSLYGLLRNFPGVPDGVGAENDLEARDSYFSPAALTPRWESWFQVVAINLTLDTALQIAIAQAEGSTFHPLAGRVAKICQEEKFHRVFGHSWLERLMGEGAQTKATLQNALNWAWTITDHWIGPDSDPVSAILVKAGVLNGGPAELRSAWLAEVEPLFAQNGLSMPGTQTDWTSWDAKLRQIVR